MGKWAKIKRRFSIFIEKSANISIVFGIFVLLVFTLVSISITITQICLIAGKKPPAPFEWITALLVFLIGINPMELSQTDYIKYVNLTQNVSIALLTLWLAFMPIFTLWKKRADLGRKSSFTIIPIYKEGTQDYEVLIDYLSGAEEAFLFSGNFSWLIKHRLFHEKVKELSKEGKIRLISYRSRSEVEKIIGTSTVKEIESSFAFDSNCVIKASFVKSFANRVFLYKHKQRGGKHFQTEEVYVVILRETDDSRYMLQAIEQFVKAQVYKSV